MNYFSLLNIPESFDIDLDALEKAYFELQQRYHPDRMAKKSVIERQAAMHLSADANKAYLILKEPLLRARYLLALKGIIVGTERDTVKPSHELLTEVMEWHTAIERAATHPHQLDEHKTLLDGYCQQSLEVIAREYQSRLWAAMAQETLRLGYILKTQQELDVHRQRTGQQAS